MTSKRSTPKPTSDQAPHAPETTPAQEWGERLDTSKTIARGGKQEGFVPGADPAPAKPAEPHRRDRRAVADALARLGEKADVNSIIDDVKSHTGIELSAGIAATLRDELVQESAHRSD